MFLQKSQSAISREIWSRGNSIAYIFEMYLFLQTYSGVRAHCDGGNKYTIFSPNGKTLSLQFSMSDGGFSVCGLYIYISAQLFVLRLLELLSRSACAICH